MIMIERLTARVLLLLLSLCLALPLRSAESVARSAAAISRAVGSSALSTNAFHPITPGPIDGQIASVTAYMLHATTTI